MDQTERKMRERERQRQDIKVWKDRVRSSMTRLGKILPLWQNLKVFRQLLKALFTIWQSFEPTLANILYFWANLHYFKWQNIENILAIWSHW